MDLENLNQFNKRLFKKLLGVYIKEKRTQLNWSIEDLALQHGSLNGSEIKMIEAGQRQLTQDEFNILRYCMGLESTELLNIGKITQVESMMGVYREIDELYPK